MATIGMTNGEDDDDEDEEEEDDDDDDADDDFDGAGLVSHLERLQVTFNRQLTGTLPNSLGSLTALQWL
jgi:hypothetical protein